MRVDRLARAFRAVAADFAGLDWWLTDGAALGCVREGRIIGGDIDIGVWAADLPKVASALSTPTVVHRSEVKSVNDGVKVDVHGHHLAGDVVWYPLGKAESVAYQFPAALFVEFELWELYDTPVWLPCPVEDYLTAHYGDWYTPRPTWRWNADPPCLRR
jgi:hypothetical protein